MFGGVLSQLQSVQHKLARLRVDIEIDRQCAVDSCIAAQATGALPQNIGAFAAAEFKATRRHGAR